jgi:hypothetical protein
MIKKGHHHWDRTARKELLMWKGKNFPGSNSKKCWCGKRKSKYHHYLCNKHAEEKRKRWENQSTK